VQLAPEIAVLPKDFLLADRFHLVYSAQQQGPIVRVVRRSGALRNLGSLLRHGLVAAVAGACLVSGSQTLAQDRAISGKIEWGLWVDADGCQHWWADGGTEGYMVPRRDPKTGKPVCVKQTSCLTESSDTYFATASATLTPSGRAKLEDYFRQTAAYSFSVVGHTDSRGSDAYNQGLSEARAEAVAAVARSVGAVVDSVTGYGESQPIASNATAKGMAKNRRVEVLCKKG
jgi:outer membrane protein OmpA-like peptidoglycan-associated protein